MIYIPIWWYSNEIKLIGAMRIKRKFTFQSGDIQICSSWLMMYCAISFTFQSGDIQINFKSVPAPASIVFTFQSGDIQIRFQIEITCRNKSIYIPIWWYSNAVGKTTVFDAFCIYIPIWWYSNLIWQMKNLPEIFHLHSNLVIFKLHFSVSIISNRVWIYIPIWWYSNVSLYSFAHSSPPLFTFQSGDIQIYCKYTYSFNCPCIYIPIWWYSNFSAPEILFIVQYIYIPIWWYSNNVWYPDSLII